MKKNSGLIIWTIAIIALLAAAYIFYTKNSTGNSNQTDKTSSTMAPDFKLKDLDGKEVKLSDYKGKVVIINFWAVWCKYCVEEMPDLNELDKELQKDNEAVILAVNVREPVDTVKNFLTTNNINLKVLMDSDGKISQTYGVQGYPTTVIINKYGSVYTYISGLTNKKTLRKHLDNIKISEPVK